MGLQNGQFTGLNLVESRTPPPLRHPRQGKAVRAPFETPDVKLHVPQNLLGRLNCTPPNNTNPHSFPCNSPGAKLENGGLPYTESPLSFDGFN